MKKTKKILKKIPLLMLSVMTVLGGFFAFSASPVAAAVLTSVIVSPSAATIQTGSVQTFTLTGLLDENGNQYALAAGDTISWTTDASPAVGTIASTPFPLAATFTGTGPGVANVTVTVTSGGISVSGSAAITVEGVPLPPVLTSVVIAPSTATIEAGAAQTFALTLRDQNGNPYNLSAGDSINWTTDVPPSVGTLTSTPFAATFTSVGQGIATITVTVSSGGINVGSSATVTVQATAPLLPVLSSIVVSPSDAVVSVGQTRVFGAIALDQIGQPMNPQPVIFWGSNNPRVATNLNQPSIAGASMTFTGVATGTAQIIARVIAFREVRGTALLTVEPVDPIASISITPATSTITVGGTVQLSATALDSSGTPLTSQPLFTWASPSFPIAVSDQNGLVTGFFPGNATITVKSSSPLSSVIGSTTVTVIPAPPADTTPPNIVLLGDNPATTTVGSAYNDAGATALDDVDGDITANIVVTGLPINTSVAGTFSVTYNVSDAAGNAATPVVRTVNVVDAPPPLPPVCETGADANGDGSIGNLEILSYIISWKSGSVSNLLILRAIQLWKAGIGC